MCRRRVNRGVRATVPSPSAGGGSRWVGRKVLGARRVLFSIAENPQRRQPTPSGGVGTTGRYARDLIRRLPGIIFTQNAIDLLDQFHQTIRILFERGFLAKTFQTFIIASRQGSPRDFVGHRGRNASGSVFGVSFKWQVGIGGRDCCLPPKSLGNIFQRNLLEIQFRCFLLLQATSPGHNLTGLA